MRVGLNYIVGLKLLAWCLAHFRCSSQLREADRQGRSNLGRQGFLLGTMVIAMGSPVNALSCTLSFGMGKMRQRLTGWRRQVGGVWGGRYDLCRSRQAQMTQPPEVMTLDLNLQGRAGFGAGCGEGRCWRESREGRRGQWS